MSKEIPASSTGMMKVPPETFFAALKIYPGDVMPQIAHGARWSQDTGYVSEWRDRRGVLFGISDGGTPFCEKRYWLT